MTAEYRFKIVMLGDGAVGKTAMTTRFTQNFFEQDYKRTIGSDFAIKRLEIPDIDVRVTLQVWDLAGQPRFESVRQGFYRGSRGGLLLYDVTRRRTFLNVDHWKEVRPYDHPDIAGGDYFYDCGHQPNRRPLS